MKEADVRTALQNLEGAMMGLRATGGWKFRRHFKGTDEDVQRYAESVPPALRLVLIRALAGEELADRWGKTFELNTIVGELKDMVSKPPPSAKEQAVEKLVELVSSQAPTDLDEKEPA